MAYRPPLIKGPVYFTIAASVRSPDIRALAISAGWQGYEAIYCTINAGVDVATLTIPNSIPSGLLTIINNGRIGGVFNSGTALTVRSNTTVINNGTICGGGGLGGSGGSGHVFYSYSSNVYPINGSAGWGGRGQGFSSTGSVTVLAQEGGSAGVYAQYSGAVLGGQVKPWAQGGVGGTGGAWGAAGGGGDSASIGGSYDGNSYTASPSSGAPAGNYIDGNAYVTWQVAGTRLGNAI